MKLRAADLRSLEAMGGKSLGINLRLLETEAPDPTPVIPVSPAGENLEQRLIAGFVVEGRAVPWKVAIHRGGYATNPKMVAWKDKVEHAARKAMGTRLPYAGRFEIRAAFFLKRFGVMPDDLNLMKSTEDALQGIVIVNDNKSRRKRIDYDPEADAKEERALIEVWTMGGAA